MKALPTAEPSDGRARPLVLRRERFGGILFDPRDGTHVEVDREGFDCLCLYLSSRRTPAGEEERALLARLGAEVPAICDPHADWRIVPDLSASVPELENVTVLGSPTLVDLQLTTRCNMGCPHCYVSSHPSGEDIPYDRLRVLLGALAEVGVCQVALGGGEPLLHPRLVDILYQARDLGLVPNLTTTGDGLTQQVIRALADCCGAVALSLEGVHGDFDARRRAGFEFFRSVHQALRSSGVRVVFQVTLSVENVPRLPSIVDYCLSCPDLYGVIFLAYKAVGRGKGFQTALSGMSAGKLYPTLRDAFLRLSERTRVGYDCCLTPGIVGIDEDFGCRELNLLEGCSAARSSIGITAGLDVVPCTFLTHRPLGSLLEEGFLEIWQGEKALSFRRELDRLVDEREACRACEARKACLGGCPEWDLVRCVEQEVRRESRVGMDRPL